MYRVKFTMSSNPEFYDTFLRAIKSLAPEVGNKRADILFALNERHGAKLISQHYTKNQQEYIFQFPDEKTYVLFLLRV
jgi:hypothetical protein